MEKSCTVDGKARHQVKVEANEFCTRNIWTRLGDAARARTSISVGSAGVEYPSAGMKVLTSTRRSPDRLPRARRRAACSLIGDADRRRAVAQRVDRARECAARPVILADHGVWCPHSRGPRAAPPPGAESPPGILQIGIHGDHRGALCALEAGHDGRVAGRSCVAVSQPAVSAGRAACCARRTATERSRLPVVDEYALVRDPKAVGTG